MIVVSIDFRYSMAVIEIKYCRIFTRKVWTDNVYQTGFFNLFDQCTTKKEDDNGYGTHGGHQIWNNDTKRSNNPKLTKANAAKNKQTNKTNQTGGLSQSETHPDTIFDRL